MVKERFLTTFSNKFYPRQNIWYLHGEILRKVLFNICWRSALLKYNPISKTLIPYIKFSLCSENNVCKTLLVDSNDSPFTDAMGTYNLSPEKCNDRPAWAMYNVSSEHKWHYLWYENGEHLKEYGIMQTWIVSTGY